MSRSMAPRRALSGLVLALALAACGGSPAATTAPTQAVVVTAAPTAVVTAAPATAAPATPAGPKEPCAKKPASSPDGSCPMPAGDYHSTRWDGGVAFTLVGTSWRNPANEPDILALVDNVGRWVSFVSGAVIGAAAPLSDPAAAMAALTAAGLTVTPVTGDTTFGGIKAEAFDVVNEDGFPAELWKAPSGQEPYFLAGASTVRVFWLEVGGAVTLILIEGPTATFDAFLEEVRPTLESISWG